MFEKFLYACVIDQNFYQNFAGETVETNIYYYMLIDFFFAISVRIVLSCVILNLKIFSLYHRLVTIFTHLACITHMGTVPILLAPPS